MIPVYRQKLKLYRPVVHRSKNWSSEEAVEELCERPEKTDWDLLRTASESLDEHIEAVTSYISLCEVVNIGEQQSRWSSST